MDATQMRRLRQFYHSLLGQQRIFDELTGNVKQRIVKVLEGELSQLHTEFPDILPTFDKRDYFAHSSMGEHYYDVTAIRIYLAMAIGRLQMLIDQPSNSPVTEKRQFPFVSNPDLRAIIERDYSEIQRAYIAECWKSVIILCGGAIEAILTDLLNANNAAATSAKSAPKKPEIARWDLSELIEVSRELDLVSAGVEKLSHSLREYRNLVHPGNELRNRLRFDAEEARIAVEVLHIVHRDMVP